MEKLQIIYVDYGLGKFYFHASTVKKYKREQERIRYYNSNLKQRIYQAKKRKEKKDRGL